MAKLRAQDVFTPGSYPEHTYVQRRDSRVDEQLQNAIDSSGQIVSIAGPSKSGKTVLVEKVVGRENLITITGSGVTNADELWTRALDAIGEPSQVAGTDVTAHKGTATVGVKGSAGVPLVARGEVSAAGSIESGQQKSTTIIVNRRGLPQVIQEIGNSTYVLLVDDFHYIPRDSQKTVAQAMKEAARQGVKLVVASVTHRSDDVIRSLPDLRGRVTNVDLQYWDKNSLSQIAVLGFDKLNVIVDSSTIERFAVEAAGSPQLMQSICLAACQEVKIRDRNDVRAKYTFTDASVDAVFERTVANTNYRTLVDILAAGPKTRGTERSLFEFYDGTSGDVYTCILRAIADDPLRQAFSYSDILDRTQKLCKALKPVGSAITGSCRHMARLALENQPEERILDWDDEKEVLDLPDPYFLFYLRWSQHLTR